MVSSLCYPVLCLYVTLSLFFFMTIWVSWFVIELYNGSGAANGGENTSMFYGMLVGGGIGLIIGVAIGIWLYLRMQRINSDIIQQIDELKKETE